MLDLACGTGQVAVPLAGRFASVVAVDQEPESVAFGRAKAQGAGNADIRWIVGAAEVAEVGSHFELVTVGNAYHRLNRSIVAARAFSCLGPGGGVALLWSDPPSRGDEAWQRALTGLMAEWMERVGTVDRVPAGWDVEMQREPHEAVLTSAGFEYLGKFEFRRQERWTATALAGYMFSTSILNRDALGDRTEALERDLASLVSSHASQGVVVADAAYAYQLARKPS